MTSLPLCFVISVSMLLYMKSPIPVQGRVEDAKTPPGMFDETMADAGKQRKYSFMEKQNCLTEQNVENTNKVFTTLFQSDLHFCQTTLSC